MKKIVYATSNPTKFQEACRFFEKQFPDITLEQYAEDVPEIQTVLVVVCPNENECPVPMALRKLER